MIHTTVSCPRCADGMDTGLVVCWLCFRETERLQEASEEDVARWTSKRVDRERAVRAAAVTS